MRDPDPRGSAIATVAVADGKLYEQLSNDWQKWQHQFRAKLSEDELREVENDMSRRVYLLCYADAKRLKVGPFSKPK